MEDSIGFIGAGKMAGAMIRGLIVNNVFSTDRIAACAPSEETRSRISSEYGIRTYPDAAEMIRDFRPGTIVIAVKPKNVDSVLAEIKENRACLESAVMISVAAGRSIASLESAGIPVVRVMPNHCCAVSEGAMGYSFQQGFPEERKKEVEKILNSSGLAAEVPESCMDAVTAVAGSSPAFMYMMIDAMADAGVDHGLPRAVALKLAAQSMLGASKMVLETGKHPYELKDEVCSPSGTTIAGVRALEELNFKSVIEEAIDVTAAKSESLGRRRRTMDFRSAIPILGPLAHTGFDSQSRSFLLQMVEFIMRVPSSLVSQRRRSLSSGSFIFRMPSTLCISSLANSVLSHLCLYSESSMRPALFSASARISAAS